MSESAVNTLRRWICCGIIVCAIGYGHHWVPNLRADFPLLMLGVLIAGIADAVLLEDQ